MILITHSNVYYLSEIKAFGRSGGEIFIGYQNFKNNRNTNGAVHTVSNIIINVLELPSEAGFGAIFHKNK